MKICIIKLGAKGDVVRTLPILEALKDADMDSEIIWITKPECKDIFLNNPFIDKVEVIPFFSTEEFDVLYNFDIDDEACALDSQIKAKKKLGFYKQGDYVSAHNIGAEYYLNTLFDDELKKTNKKTYQEMMFQAAELDWKKQTYEIYLSKQEKEYAQNFSKENNINPKKLIGIHMGASSRWPSKVWHPDRVREFIVQAKGKGFEILLFGGPNEIQKHESLVSELDKNGIKVFRNNPKNTDREFFSLVNLCQTMICSDSFALHVALAFQKPTISLFFCTSPDEVESYNLLVKLKSPVLYEFFPERSDLYDETLVKSISAEQVLKEVEKILNK